MDPTPEQVLNQSEMVVRNDANWIKLRDSFDPVVKQVYEEYDVGFNFKGDKKGKESEVWLVTKSSEFEGYELSLPFLMRYLGDALKFIFDLDLSLDFEDFDLIIKVGRDKNRKGKSLLRYTNDGILVSEEGLKILPDPKLRSVITGALIHELIHLIRDYEEKQTAGDESTPLLFELVYPCLQNEEPREIFFEFERREGESDPDKYLEAYKRAKSLLLNILRLPPNTSLRELITKLRNLAQDQKKELLNLLRIELEK